LPKLEPTDITFFETPVSLRDWLAEHHASAAELWLGFRKVASGAPSVTWPQAVDEALCVGWIDGIRKRIDDASYTIRFTPRKRDSTWSAVNVARVAVLQAEGRMQPPGLAAFAARRPENTAVYAYEVGDDGLSEEHQARLDAVPAARAYWEAQTRSYRRTAAHWVMSAKQEATRERRLETLVESCAAGRLIPPMRYGRGAESAGSG
jgi:uncharacterized protein YdeI (YjbR/CyaY-like superfamily)